MDICHQLGQCACTTCTGGLRPEPLLISRTDCSFLRQQISGGESANSALHAMPPLLLLLLAHPGLETTEGTERKGKGGEEWSAEIEYWEQEQWVKQRLACN